MPGEASSRFLARRMFAGLDLSDEDVIIEYGPGTGAFTREIDELRKAGRDIRYLGVEKDPGMHAFLEQRFPGLDFALGDAINVREHCAERGLPPAAVVISGLPLIFFERDIVEAIIESTNRCLRSDGVFRTFSYVHSYPARGAVDLRQLMVRFFGHFELSWPVLRNLPPAITLTGRTPLPVVSVPG